MSQDLLDFAHPPIRQDTLEVTTLTALQGHQKHANTEPQRGTAGSPRETMAEEPRPGSHATQHTLHLHGPNRPPTRGQPCHRAACVRTQRHKGGDRPIWYHCRPRQGCHAPTTLPTTATEGHGPPQPDRNMKSLRNHPRHIPAQHAGWFSTALPGPPLRQVLYRFPLRHGAASLYVRQVQILLTPGLSLPDGHIHKWIMLH